MIPATWKRGAACAALSLGAALPASMSANAAEAILFDGNNCSGQYRMLDRSVENFNQIGFDNEVNSLMVITGSFQFYRDANYGEGNGPSFQLGPSGYTETCWSLNDASNGNFPNDRMSSAQLLQDSEGPQPLGVAIVYDNNNFGGQYRIITRDVANFNNIGFDNEVNSIQVISGVWTFYRNNNYDAPPNRPSITLTPGSYPDIANLAGYQPNYFPADRMSSAQVQSDVPPPPPPPPPPLQCAAGEVPGQSQCIPCGQFNAVPSAAGDQCVCAPGYEAVNSGILDGVQVEVCQMSQTPPAPNCPGPYQYLDPATNQCAFNCHQSTQPNPQTGQCDCLPGTQQAGFLNDGRQYCLGIPNQDQQPVQSIRYTVPASQIIPAAMAAGFTMTTQIDEGGATCTISGDTIVFQMVNAPDNKPRSCIATLFGGRSLASGWTFEDYNAGVAVGQAVPYGLTAQLPFQIRLSIPPFADKTIVDLNSIDLIGPSGQNWQQALQ